MKSWCVIDSMGHENYTQYHKCDKTIFAVPFTIRKLKQRRFWATHVNRKWGLLHFYMPWRWQICIAKFILSCKDDLPKSFNQTTAQWRKKFTSGWLSSLKKTLLLKLPIILDKTKYHYCSLNQRNGFWAFHIAGAPNQNIVQNHLNIALLNVF